MCGTPAYQPVDLNWTNISGLIPALDKLVGWFSSMTRRTILQRLHFPMVNQLCADLTSRFGNIFGLVAIGWLPIEISDFVERTNLRRRIAMALQAKTHAERLRVEHFIHLVHTTVTLYTTHTAIHVNRVIEIGVIGKLMDLHPLNGLASSSAFANRCESRIIF